MCALKEKSSASHCAVNISSQMLAVEVFVLASDYFDSSRFGPVRTRFRLPIRQRHEPPPELSM